MYFIALCDDEIRELDKTENMLRAYMECTGCNYTLERFSSADELLWAVREREYMPDLLLMDIYLPGKSGMEASRELRKMGVGCRIIFLTTSVEHALEAFRVDAAQYLVKPVREKEMASALDRIFEHMEKEQKKYLLLKIESRMCRVALRDIVFCEAQKKCQCMYLSDGTQLMLRMTMARIYEMLSAYPEFSKAGISYIVNMEHIESLSAQEMHMDNGKKIYLPRGSYQILRKNYFSYYCEA